MKTQTPIALGANDKFAVRSNDGDTLKVLNLTYGVTLPHSFEDVRLFAAATTNDTKYAYYAVPADTTVIVECYYGESLRLSFLAPDSTPIAWTVTDQHVVLYAGNRSMKQTQDNYPY